MKRVKVKDAIGKELAHDVIKYGSKTKKVLFERGHEVKEEDIEELKNTGNYFVFISEEEEKGVHENEAAVRMAKASIGENATYTNPRKGRVRILSEIPGLLKVKQEIIKKINLKNNFIFALAGNEIGVSKREEIASAKIDPLIIKETQMKEVEKILRKNEPVIEVEPIKVKTVGVIITGTEIYQGKVEDAFEPKLKEKLSKYNLKISNSSILPDDKEKIKNKILEFKENHDLILVTGGMAVDSQDVTPSAIKDTGAKIIAHNVPIFPGNMVMIGEFKNSMVLGLPACVIPDEKTSFDIILPKVLAKEKLTKEKIANLGKNGLLK